MKENEELEQLDRQKLMTNIDILPVVQKDLCWYGTRGIGDISLYNNHTSIPYQPLSNSKPFLKGREVGWN